MYVSLKFLKVIFFFAAGVFFLTGCATNPNQQFQDPFEKTNRQIYKFNEGVDKVILKPSGQAYAYIMPDILEEGVGNFFDNLSYPNTVINQFLQGKAGEGFVGLGRFGLNSTLGIGGIFDVASGIGLKEDKEDFGQTLSAWGVGTGPYIVAPIIGGVTLRDGVGQVAALPLLPQNWVGNGQNLVIGLAAGSAVETSASLLEARKLVTGDKYLFTRDAYLQRRQFLISDGVQDEEDPFLDDFIDDEESSSDDE
ncbi:MAG: VacJ family lipoprotein [Litorimonas sp.]